MIVKKHDRYRFFRGLLSALCLRVTVAVFYEVFLLFTNADSCFICTTSMTLLFYKRELRVNNKETTYKLCICFYSK